MQKKKEIIRQQILDASINEFCDKGFCNTSVRNIAKKAGISAGNIYNYFKSKDEIFNELLSHIIMDIEKGKRYLSSPQAAEEICNLDEHLDLITLIINYIEKNRDLFKILYFNSFGSKYENYIEWLSEWYTDMTEEYLPYISLIENVDEINIDRFVLHNISGIWIQFFREALMYNTSGEEFNGAARDLMTFSYRGWKGLFKYKACG